MKPLRLSGKGCSGKSRGNNFCPGVVYIYTHHIRTVVVPTQPDCITM